ncbi:MAG TPA: ROK family protein [Pyrinomonadaceae bacterium]|jgi:glucokinase|nr:ROK family protein [Pyrinomonadaceae bacterium]
MSEAVAGVDIGGTKIALALETIQGERISSRQFPTRVELGPEAILDNIVSALCEMSAGAQVGLTAIGLSCPGSIDKARGLPLRSIHLPGWHEFPVVRLLEERLRVPTMIENDAKLAALGEYVYGAGRGFGNIFYITISTGIGGGIIIGGEIFHGLGNGAGEVGHTIVLPGGPLCGCGLRGCLDALCSGTAMVKRARKLLAKGASSILEQMVDHPDEITAQTIALAEQRGDSLAREIWAEMIHFLSIGIGNVITILAPEAVILGGGVAATGEQLLGPLRPLIQQRVTMLPVEKVKILQAALAGESGVYGALVIARQAASTNYMASPN